MAYTLDKVDLKLLGKIAADGPTFPKGATVELRAASMRRAGYLTGEMKMYSMTGGGKSATFRTEYTITPKGIAALGGTASQTGSVDR